MPPLILFVGIHLISLAAIAATHLARNRITLAPTFASGAVLTMLIWNLLDTGWWVSIDDIPIDAALMGVTPAIFCGLMLIYAMDGIRAGRAYVATVLITSLVATLMALFLDQLGDYMPQSSPPLYPWSVHLALAFSLSLGGLAQISAFELIRRRLPPGPSMALALLVGLFLFSASSAALIYGLETGWTAFKLALPGTLLVSLLPMLVLALSGGMACHMGLMLPARPFAGLLAGWRQTEHDLLSRQEDFVKAHETIRELRQLNSHLTLERRLRAYQVEHSPLAIIEALGNGKIRSFNPAAQTLFGGRLAIGGSMETLLPGSMPSPSEPIGPSRVLMLPPTSPPNGPPQHLQVNILQMGGAAGSPAYSFVFEDITERERQAFGKTVHARVRGIQMTSQVISHDFANLILAIEASLARIRAIVPGELTRHLETALTTIEEAASRSRDLLKQLGAQQPFDLPRLENHTLGELVQQAVRLQQAGARQAQVRIEIEGLANPIVSCDATQMIRVLMNLIGNAIRACHENGLIRITLTEETGGAVIRIRDNGIGMPPSQLERAFEPGFSSKGGGQGGLGLAISYLIVDAHGGRLRLSSCEGLGTTAEVSLPLGAPDSLPDHPRSLLVICGDPELRLQLAEWYQQQGGEAIEVGDCQELEAILDEYAEPWELVLRTADFPVPQSLRQRLRDHSQLLVGKYKRAFRPGNDFRLSSNVMDRLASIASGQVQ